MSVKAVSITEEFFFWRCDCGWESEKLPASNTNLPPPPHKCHPDIEFSAQESA